MQRSAVAAGLARWDELQADSFAEPVGHCGAGELRAVVAAQHGRIAPVDGDAVELIAHSPSSSSSAGARPLDAVPGSEVSPGKSLRCGLLQLRVGQQPLSVAFSHSRSLSRLASYAVIPPNWLHHR